MTPEQSRVYEFGKMLGWTRKMNCWLDETRVVVADSGWNPFNNVHDAMIPFQKLRESGNWCCLSIDCDYNYCTQVKLTPAFEPYDENNHEPAIIVQEHECGLHDLAELICNAVMKAKDYEKAFKPRPKHK